MPDNIKIVNQAVIVFTLLSNGTMHLASLGQNGNNETEEFTDACMRAVGAVLAASDKFGMELESGDE